MLGVRASEGAGRSGAGEDVGGVRVRVRVRFRVTARVKDRLGKPGPQILRGLDRADG